MTIVLVEHNIEEIKEEVDYFVSLDRNGNVIDNAKRIRGDDGEKREETFFLCKGESSIKKAEKQRKKF